QRGCMGREKIFPTEVGDDAVLGPAFTPDRFHQPDVLVDAPTRAFDFHGAQEHSVSLSKTRHCYLSTLVRSTTNSRQRGHIVSLGFTWIRQAIIVFRPFSEHSGVKGPKNLRTWASVSVAYTSPAVSNVRVTSTPKSQRIGAPGC